MKKLICRIYLLTAIMALTGCAASYHPIIPPTLQYSAHELSGNVKLSYRYNVLTETRNRKYAKKEYKNGIKLIAVKITNLADTSITIGRDVYFYSGDHLINPMLPKDFYITTRQSVLSYLPYMLFTVLKLYVTTGTMSSSTDTQVYPIGYGLGPGLTIINMTKASSANRSLLNELNAYNLMNVSIPKGATVYGLIGVSDSGFNPLHLRAKSN